MRAGAHSAALADRVLTEAAQRDGRTSEQSQQCRDYVVKFLIAHATWCPPGGLEA